MNTSTLESSRNPTSPRLEIDTLTPSKAPIFFGLDTSDVNRTAGVIDSYQDTRQEIHCPPVPFLSPPAEMLAMVYDDFLPRKIYKRLLSEKFDNCWVGWIFRGLDVVPQLLDAIEVARSIDTNFLNASCEYHTHKYETHPIMVTRAVRICLRLCSLFPVEAQNCTSSSQWPVFTSAIQTRLRSVDS
ncbi:hypothetical protein K469DRAFT_682604 [Zopfia rhizophila CBS 207.26]|uniref:Uncharacterized protein n=1 Tax=Zopfia rhizophila CBS 207.26 TaxID=1314779 RepID=A0A6A6D9Y7_9PEZI|nr:hypothetical protein K469DRAFT_682604 [Zopfia rhizophila CBS 207.26]